MKVHKSLRLFGWAAGMDEAMKTERFKNLEREYNGYFTKLIERR